jgi:hypothetical protein
MKTLNKDLLKVTLLSQFIMNVLWPLGLIWGFDEDALCCLPIVHFWWGGVPTDLPLSVNWATKCVPCHMQVTETKSCRFNCLILLQIICTCNGQYTRNFCLTKFSSDMVAYVSPLITKFKQFNLLHVTPIMKSICFHFQTNGKFIYWKLFSHMHDDLIHTMYHI